MPAFAGLPALREQAGMTGGQDTRILRYRDTRKPIHCSLLTVYYLLFTISQSTVYSLWSKVYYLPPGVGLGVNFFEPFRGQVSVNLRGGKGSVSQELLHGPQVCSSFQ